VEGGMSLRPVQKSLFLRFKNYFEKNVIYFIPLIMIGLVIAFSVVAVLFVTIFKWMNCNTFVFTDIRSKTSFNCHLL
jgi:hypothetical protein